MKSLVIALLELGLCLGAFPETTNRTYIQKPLIKALEPRDECFCRQSESGQTQIQRIGSQCAGAFDNYEPGTVLGEHVFWFDQYSSLSPLFFKWGAGGFNMVCADEFLVPEAQAACQSWWSMEGVYNGFYFSPATSQTLDGGAKYFIPYCFGMESIYLYKIVGLGWEKSFQLVDVFPLPHPLESLKFFGETLVVVDQEYITLYTLRGRKIVRETEYYFPHPMEEYHWIDPSNGHKRYFPIKDYLLLDGHFYLLISMNMENFGPLLTFKYDGRQLILLDKGLVFPLDAMVRDDLQSDRQGDSIYLGYGGNDFFKITENGIPEYLFRDINYSGFCVLCQAWKDGGIYYPTHPTADCKSILKRFTETGLEDTVFYSFGFEKKNMISDTESFSDSWVTLTCGTDILPAVTYEIFPGGPISDSFLVAGTAWDSEGIRSVFSGSAFWPYLWRADIFHRDDGSVFWMAKMEERLFKGTEGFPFSPCGLDEATLATVAEDSDWDTNLSLDNPPWQDMRCIKIKTQPDPTPVGEVEVKPCGDETILNFSGWAVDNSGIWQGWLFSEDAQVLAPLTVGIARPDIGAQYPGDPGNGQAGFSITYDASAIPEGTYEFTVRLVAHDYQVLDFGPYIITRDTSHPRPVSPP
jgi:hypothetical protein